MKVGSPGLPERRDQKRSFQPEKRFIRNLGRKHSPEFAEIH